MNKPWKYSCETISYLLSKSQIFIVSFIFFCINNVNALQHVCVCVFISTLHFTLCLHCAPFSSHFNSLKIEMNLLCTSHSISHLYE